MNFIKKIKVKISIPAGILSRIWLLFSIFLAAIAVITFIGKIYLGQHARIEQALLGGQRLEIEINTGAVNGKTTVTEKPAEAAEPVAETAAVPAEEKPAEPTPEQDTKPDEEMAWINSDFIGPPMQQELIDILTKNTSNEPGLEVKKISVSELGDKPVIVVIIKGLGLSASTTEAALELPKNVTLGFSPYSPSLAESIKAAKSSGHEIILNIPMETKDFNINDPGPYALATKATKEDNITRLKMLLALMDGYEGVYSDDEEVFTHSIMSVSPILETLKNQKKYFIYGGGYSDFSIIQVAEGMNYPILVNDVLLDNEISADAINKKFQEVEDIAKSRGFAVVMAHPYPITVRMLERWLPESEKRGFAISPVSVLLGKSFSDKKQ